MAMTSSRSDHDRITNALERCRNGKDLRIELPGKTATIQAEQGDIASFIATVDDDTTEIGGLALWELLAEYDYYIEL